MTASWPNVAIFSRVTAGTISSTYVSESQTSKPRPKTGARVSIVVRDAVPDSSMYAIKGIAHHRRGSRLPAARHREHRDVVPGGDFADEFVDVRVDRFEDHARFAAVHRAQHFADGIESELLLGDVLGLG